MQIKTCEGQGVLDDHFVESKKNIFENNGNNCNHGTGLFTLFIDS
jgi:hypothetical protein